MKSGDVVRLKGTRMKMTVSSIINSRVSVVWFDREDKLNNYIFDLSDLELGE